MVVAALLAGAAKANPWSLPAEGSCSRATGEEGDDAVPFPFKPGDVIDLQKASLLQNYLPDEFWDERERFFFDGMQLEIGPCYRDYGPPAFFSEATQRFAGKARLDADGMLHDQVAGLPFPPDAIEPEDPLAGLKWAWNWVSSYGAGGNYSDLQLTWVEHDAVEARFRGEFFFVPLHWRSDRPDDGYRFPVESDARWVSGGHTKNLAGGHTCAWRQYDTGGRSPEMFRYSPGARKVRRIASADAEGPSLGCLAGGSYSGLHTHGESPQLHRWKVVGVRDLLAPLNAKRPAYPEDKARSFGPYAVSFANDRWDLRRTLVIEGELKEGAFSDGVKRYRWYLDLQTLERLYYASYREDGTSTGIGTFVGRWSEDRDDYRPWPDDPKRAVRIVDTVGYALVDTHHLEALRFEAWNTVSTPPNDEKIKRMISQSSLRGR